MKLAVILGILQMCLGIIMKGLNHLHYKQRLEFIFEFIPQLILMLALFGWMDVLIVAKWMTPKNVDGIFSNGTAEYDAIFYSPAIITTMIDIFLSFASNEDSGTKSYNYLIEG